MGVISVSTAAILRSRRLIVITAKLPPFSHRPYYVSQNADLLEVHEGTAAVYGEAALRNIGK